VRLTFDTFFKINQHWRRSPAFEGVGVNTTPAVSSVVTQLDNGLPVSNLEVGFEPLTRLWVKP